VASASGPTLQRILQVFAHSARLTLLHQPVAAIHHDHSGTPDTRTITVNGQQRPYTDQSTWTGLAGGVHLPAAVVPVGSTRDALPVGLQIIAPFLEDRTAIDVARHIEHLLGGYQQPLLAAH